MFGFTLFEVLTVVAIIAIVAAILFPVITRARIAGERSVAISNTRQICQAIAIYSTEYGDRIPGNRSIKQGYWMAEIGMIVDGRPRLRDPRFFYKPDEPGHLYESLAGYAINACLRPDRSNRYVADQSRTVLIAPSTVWLISDPTLHSTIPEITLVAPDTKSKAWLEQSNSGHTVYPDGPLGSQRYFGSGVYGFLDGHVKVHRPEAFEEPPLDNVCGFQGTPPTYATHTGPTFVVPKS